MNTIWLHFKIQVHVIPRNTYHWKLLHRNIYYVNFQCGILTASIKQNSVCVRTKLNETRWNGISVFIHSTFEWFLCFTLKSMFYEWNRKNLYLSSRIWYLLECWFRYSSWWAWKRKYLVEGWLVRNIFHFRKADVRTFSRTFLTDFCFVSSNFYVKIDSLFKCDAPKILQVVRNSKTIT